MNTPAQRPSAAQQALSRGPLSDDGNARPCPGRGTQGRAVSARQDQATTRPSPRQGTAVTTPGREHRRARRAGAKAGQI